MKKLTAFLAFSALTAASLMPASVSAADWKDSDCRNDVDSGGNTVQVCRAAESLGIFWADGSYANGWCDGREYDVDYKGIGKDEAIAWVKAYCN